MKFNFCGKKTMWCCSDMRQLRSLEQGLQKDDTLRKPYQETSDTDIKAGYIRKIDQNELNETRHKLQWYLPRHPVINLRTSEECATQQQSTKV